MSKEKKIQRAVKQAKKKAKFKKATHEEAKKDHHKYISTTKRDKIDKARQINFEYINLKVMEARMKFRLEQLGTDKKKANIKELFEGAPKPKYMLEAEYNADLYGYKLTAGGIEKLKRELMDPRYGYTEEQVHSMMLGTYHLSEVIEEEENEETPTYMG